MQEGYLSDITEESKKNGEIHRELFSPMCFVNALKAGYVFSYGDFQNLIKKYGHDTAFLRVRQCHYDICKQQFVLPGMFPSLKDRQRKKKDRESLTL